MVALMFAKRVHGLNIVIFLIAFSAVITMSATMLISIVAMLVEVLMMKTDSVGQ